MANKQGNSKKGKASPPKDETPAQAFKRLANRRTNTALKQIELLGQLAGPAYESSDVQKNAIVESLKAALEGLADVFAGKGKATDRFRVPD